LAGAATIGLVGGKVIKVAKWLAAGGRITKIGRLTSINKKPGYYGIRWKTPKSVNPKTGERNYRHHSLEFHTHKEGKIGLHWQLNKWDYKKGKGWKVTSRQGRWHWWGKRIC
jgi:hypothetical protein